MPIVDRQKDRYVDRLDQIEDSAFGDLGRKNQMGHEKQQALLSIILVG